MPYNLKSPKDRELFLQEVEKNLREMNEVELYPTGQKRSLRANRLYWAWMQCLEDETGQYKEDFHDYFKAKYLGTEQKEIFGLLIDKEITTTTLKSKEFWIYMQKVQAEAASEFGVTVPLPEDKGYDEFVRKYHWMFEK